jgi:hypothetical protein
MERVTSAALEIRRPQPYTSHFIDLPPKNIFRLIIFFIRLTRRHGKFKQEYAKDDYEEAEQCGCIHWEIALIYAASGCGKHGYILDGHRKNWQRSCSWPVFSWGRWP